MPQGNRSDLIFDGTGVQTEGAFVQKVDQVGPVREGVADVLGQLGFLRDVRQLGLQPRLERGDDWGCMFTSYMGPAIDQLPQAGVARDLGQRVVGLTGVALQEPAAVYGEELQRMLFPRPGVMEQHDGRSAPP